MEKVLINAPMILVAGPKRSHMSIREDKKNMKFLLPSKGMITVGDFSAFDRRGRFYWIVRNDWIEGYE
jgi:hypothetical protein